MVDSNSQRLKMPTIIFNFEVENLHEVAFEARDIGITLDPSRHYKCIQNFLWNNDDNVL